MARRARGSAICGVAVLAVVAAILFGATPIVFWYSVSAGTDMSAALMAILGMWGLATGNGALAAAGFAFGLVPWRPQLYSFTDITATAFKLDLGATAKLGFIEIVFVFLFVDMFDNLGTLVGVGKKAGLFNEANEIPRLNRILMADATATVASSLAGTQRLGNLTLLWDDNHISIEDDTNVAFTEDVCARYEAYGWHVQRVSWLQDDGSYEARVVRLVDPLRDAGAATP